MTSISSQVVPLQKPIKAIHHSSSSLLKNKTCSNANIHQRSKRKLTSSSVKNMNVKTHYSHKSINEKELFQYKKRNSCCTNKKHSFRSRYQRENVSTKESSSLDITETIPKFRKKAVSFARPFVNVIKIISYKEYNQLQTYDKQIIIETDTINNDNRKNKVGCSCLIY